MSLPGKSHGSNSAITAPGLSKALHCHDYFFGVSMSAISDLIHYFAPYLPILAWISAITFVLSLILVPILLAKIPADYFRTADIPRTKNSSSHYSLIWLVRNTVSLVFIFAGIAMLVLPGQG